MHNVMRTVNVLHMPRAAAEPLTGSRRPYLPFSLTLINQGWVGRVTIYASRNEANRQRLHNAIITKLAPDRCEDLDELAGRHQFSDPWPCGRRS